MLSVLHEASRRETQYSISTIYLNHSLRRCSVILVSPTNEVLLLHRVHTSTSFASAHVFPGGNLSDQDGPCPPAEDHTRHDDAPHYRKAAIRELFEESGILLAKNQTTDKMLVVDETTREKGRALIHQNKLTFDEWLKKQHSAAEPDIGQFYSLHGLSLYDTTKLTLLKINWSLSLAG
ncbi:hypothetical protein N7456_009992 [Penicillium angulare]|uniref:Nudix hydrolase domain-containing protein n=1 Tax=Penicillium angulare TaxID=116970 RepID=A0A9W9F5S6_9EURO|nr:hypothetical protein N7456_009992 [Penicillium angulare]